MTRKRTSAADGAPAPMRVVVVTMDTHLSSATERARAALGREIPGLRVIGFQPADKFLQSLALARRF